MAKVKCRECGYLAVYDEYSTGSCEADDRVRDHGLQVSSVNGRGSRARVFCYQNVREFTAAEIEGQATVVAAINQEIDCDAFRKRERGKTAEKIQETAILEQVRDENRRAREEDQRLNASWRQGESAQRAEFEAAIERRHKELKDDGEKRHRQQADWQGAVEANVGRRFQQAEANAESRHGRTIGFNFLTAVVVALIGASGGVAVLIGQWLIRFGR
jgi:hypothetical protein